ncbi:hypothetical protein BDZ91DRAFT_767490 [Kalaharituber pfeilii]|nr:hypothetical protein BDZ91DRAFT_767490 [Kalaharituber pfeilii]
MSPTSSIPEEVEEETYGTAPPTPQEDSDESTTTQSYPPLHPVPSMQAAFEESMYEQGHPPPESSSPYAVVPRSGSSSSTTTFKPKYHPLTKLVSQIAFGIHLLHKRLAKSDAEVVRILQAHVNDMDNFLSTTTRDFDAARADISQRIKNLKVPLESGPASDVFENMLRDPAFRGQILEGNKKVDFVIKRTAKAMNRALEDVGEGLRAVDELAKYLVTLKSGWKNANLVRVYGAMTHNVEGWFRCFVGLQMKGQGLGERLNTLKMVVWEIERRCGRASRGGSGARGSMAVVKKKVFENPIAETNDATPAPRRTVKSISELEKLDEKPLPTTPIPTPVPVVATKNTTHKRHSSGDVVGSPPASPKRMLSQRRSSLIHVPSTSTSTPPKEGQSVESRTVETIVVLDHGSGTLRRKRIHRRSVTVHTTPTNVTQLHHHTTTEEKVNGAPSGIATTVTGAATGAQDAKDNAAAGNGGGVLSSLRRSLSLGRSTGRARSRSRDSKSADGEERGRASTAAPPVPRLPANVTAEIERMKRDSKVQETELGLITPPVSRDSASTAPNAGAQLQSEAEAPRPKSSGGSGHGGMTGAVMAAIKKRKSKTHMQNQINACGGSNGSDAHKLNASASSSSLRAAIKASISGKSHAEEALAAEQQPPPPAPRRMRRTHTAPLLSTPEVAGSKKSPNGPPHSPLRIKTSVASVASSDHPSGVKSATTPTSQTPTTPRAKSRRNSTAISNLLSLRPRSRHGVTPEPTSPPPLPELPELPGSAVRNTDVALVAPGRKALATQKKRRIKGPQVRQLQKAKQKPTPAFKLQGAAATVDPEPLTPVTSPIQVPTTPKKHNRRESIFGGGSAAGKKHAGLQQLAPASQAPDLSASPSAGTRGKNSFLVRFFSDRAF